MTFKLLRVISSLNPISGGPIEGIKQFYQPMNILGVETEIVCCDDPKSPWLDASGLSVIHALGPSYTSYAYAPKLLSWLSNNVSRFDAVIIHGIWQYHAFAVRQSLLGSKIPYFVFTHGMLDPWFKKTYPFKHLKKWILWPWSEYRVLRDAKNVIFTSQEECLLARQSFWLYSAKEMVSPYGVSSPPNSKSKLISNFMFHYPNLMGKRLILFLGRIQEKKGCDLLIDAFSKVAFDDERLHLVMVGPDQEGWTNLLKKQSVNLGISDRISWLGMLRGDLKWGAYYSAEIFCLPSHQENFGISVAEALACGKPVLISNKINIWREIMDSNAGFINEDDAVGTLQNIKSWLELDKVAYDQMAKRAVDCFYANFHVDFAAQKLLKILRG